MGSSGESAYFEGSTTFWLRACVILSKLLPSLPQFLHPSSGANNTFYDCCQNTIEITKERTSSTMPATQGSFPSIFFSILETLLAWAGPGWPGYPLSASSHLPSPAPGPSAFIIIKKSWILICGMFLSFLFLFFFFLIVIFSKGEMGHFHPQYCLVLISIL